MNISAFINSTLDASYSNKQQMACSLYDLLIEAVLMGVLCLFGFCGNTLSMVCLSKDKSKTATPFLLISLEIADTFFLITVLLLRVIPSIHTFTSLFTALETVFAYMGKFIFPCALISSTATIYLTILVTVNRYVSVCRPYEASDLCSVQHARKHVILVSLFSILFNIPRFFTARVAPVWDIRTNTTKLNVIPTALGQNKIFIIIYGNVLYFLVNFLLPLATLIVLNYKLIVALRKTKKKRAQLLRGNSESAQSRSEDDITLVLIVVVLVFVVCQMPALITQILTTIYTHEGQQCPQPYFYYARISDALVVANSSLNFLIYCFCSTKFRQILVHLVCPNARSLHGNVEAPSHTANKSGYKQVAAEPAMKDAKEVATQATVL